MAERDWSKVDRVVRSHIVENAKAYIDAQMSLATAADQRACALAGIFTAAGTALIAGLIALGTASSGGPVHRYPEFLSGGITALSFIVAGLLCIASALPVDMYLPGGQPKSWDKDIADEKSYDVILKEEAEIIQEKINENRVVVQKNARLFKWGALIGISAPVTGTLVWALTASSYLF
jgi:hypothetical protein